MKSKITLWIVLVALAIGLFLFIASGFSLFTGSFILCGIAIFLPVFIFGSTTFLLGYGQTSNLPITILLLAILGIVTYVLSPLITLSADPRWTYGIIKLLLLFSITFGAGYLARHLPMMGQITTAVAMGMLLFYIAIAGLNGLAYSPIDLGNVFASKQDEEQNGIRYYYDYKMFIDPFPARVVGIRQCNDKGELVGYSRNEKFYSTQQKSMEDSEIEGEITTDNSNILLHKNYEKNLRTILSPAQNAIRIDRKQYSVLMYHQGDTLYRKEILYFPNGVVNRVSHYYFDDAKYSFREHHQESSNIYIYYEQVFDPLGYLLEQPWSVHHFHKTNEVPDVVHSIGASLDSIEGNTLNKQQKRTFEWIHVSDTLLNTLSKEKQSYDPFSILCASRFALTDTLSIYVDNDSDMDEINFYTNRFTPLKSAEEMEVVGNALALCRLESAMGECAHGESCDRIRVQKRGTDNHIGLYLFEDKVISADLRFYFIYDPTMHSEPKKQADAKRLWSEMKMIIDSYQ